MAGAEPAAGGAGRGLGVGGRRVSNGPAEPREESVARQGSELREGAATDRGTGAAGGAVVIGAYGRTGAGGRVGRGCGCALLRTQSGRRGGRRRWRGRSSVELGAERRGPSPSGPWTFRPVRPAVSVRSGAASAQARPDWREARSAAQPADAMAPPRPGTGAGTGTVAALVVLVVVVVVGLRARPTPGTDVAAARRVAARGRRLRPGSAHWLDRRRSHPSRHGRLLLGDLGRLVGLLRLRAAGSARGGGQRTPASALRLRAGRGRGLAAPARAARAGRLDRLRRGRIGGGHEPAGPARHVRDGRVGVPGFALERPPRSCHGVSLSGADRRGSGM